MDPGLVKRRCERLGNTETSGEGPRNTTILNPVSGPKVLLLTPTLPFPNLFLLLPYFRVDTLLSTLRRRIPVGNTGPSSTHRETTDQCPSSNQVSSYGL